MYCIIKCTTIKSVINFVLQDAFWIMRRRIYLIFLLYVLISFCVLWCVAVSSCLIELDIILRFIHLQISSQNDPYIISKVYLLHYIWTLFMISFSPSNVYGKHMLKRYTFFCYYVTAKHLIRGRHVEALVTLVMHNRLFNIPINRNIIANPYHKIIFFNHFFTRSCKLKGM